MIVVDTNLIGYLYLKNDRSYQAEQVFFRDTYWIAPLLWRSELRNVLALYFRKNLITLDTAIDIMEEATILMRGNEYQIPSEKVLRLVEKSSCSAYDCEFVALAQDLEVPLVTVDKQILRDFPNFAISIDDYLNSI